MGYPHQTERLDAALERLGVEAVVASSVANIAYVTGFRSLSRVVHPTTAVALAVYSRRGTALIVPTIDVPAVAAAAVDADHVLCHGRFAVDVAEGAGDVARRAAALAATPAASAADALVRALATLGLDGTVALDDATLPAAAAEEVGRRLAPRRVVTASAALGEARAVKGPYEIECLAQALRIAEESIHALLDDVKPGITEREAVRLFEANVLSRDATPHATIIAFGENAALPAAWPTDRALRRGDLVRFDLGCVFRGYHADVARMAMIGEPDPGTQSAYDAVEAGVDAALDAIRPGIAGGAVFDATVEAVRAAGLPRFDRQHVGYGIGLDAVETPRLAPDGGTLDAGMVLRIEAPWYLLGAYGIDVKETVLVTRSGCTAMNRSNRGLIALD
jgi:Xaa-Pro aminopeptidase